VSHIIYKLVWTLVQVDLRHRQGGGQLLLGHDSVVSKQKKISRPRGIPCPYKFLSPVLRYLNTLH
jgi:hypothetical protein